MSSEDEDEDGGVLIFSTWFYWIIIILIVVAIICSLGSWTFVFYYRNKPIVAMGQPTFLYNLCFGSLLLPISSVLQVVVSFLDYDENGKIIPADSKTGIILNVCCNSAVWLTYIGFTVIYTALLCKIYRIMKITQQPLQRGLKILPKQVLWPFILVVSLTVGLLSAWSTTGTSKYVLWEFPDTNQIAGYCALTLDGQNEQSSKYYIVALSVLLLLVQLVLAILACKIRKINQELGDGKRILNLNIFLFIFVIVCFGIVVAIDKIVINDNEKNDVTGLFTAIRLVVPSIATMAFMIFPRMYYVWFQHRHGHLPEHIVMIGGGTASVRGLNSAYSSNGSIVIHASTV